MLWKKISILRFWGFRDIRGPRVQKNALENFKFRLVWQYTGIIRVYLTSISILHYMHFFTVAITFTAALPSDIVHGVSSKVEAPKLESSLYCVKKLWNTYRYYVRAWSSEVLLHSPSIISFPGEHREREWTFRFYFFQFSWKNIECHNNMSRGELVALFYTTLILRFHIFYYQLFSLQSVLTGVQFYWCDYF